METKEISDWQAVVNKPVYTVDGKQVGILSSVQAERIVVTYGPITPNKYLIPKSSIKEFKDGIVYLIEREEFVVKNYQFE